MERFLQAHSTHPDAITAVTECLQHIGELPAEASLGFIYVTDKHAHHFGDILRHIKQQTGLQDWLGTIGMAICCTRQEFYDQPAMVMMITDIPHEHYRFFTSAQDISDTQSDNELRVAIVHGDPRNGQLPNLIHDLPDRIGNGYLVGGLTSSDSQHYQIARDIEEGMLSGVIFDGHVKLATGISQGCTPIGKTHTLTACDSNIAISIDGRPALEVMKEDIGEVLSRDLNRIGGYIFAGFPIEGRDTRDYRVRNLMGIDPQSGALAIGDYLKEDTAIMFCKRDGSTAVEDLRNMLGKLQTRSKQAIRGGLYISCLGRGQHMFGHANREMELIEETLGDIPIVGFYANGEIAGNQLYGYTGVLLLFY